MNNVLSKDWDSMMKQADQMSPEDVFGWLRVLNRRLLKILNREELTLATCEPEDLDHLPLAVINRLIERGELLNVGQAQEHSGLNSRQSMYAACSANSYRMKHIKIDERYYFRREWIDEYTRNNPGRGRRYPK